MAAPNSRGERIEIGKRVKVGQEQGVVQRLVGVSSVVVVTDGGQSLTVELDELEPME